MSQRKLIIVGAGDFAREVIWLARQIPANAREWVPVGFLDDDVERSRDLMRRVGEQLPVLGTIQDYTPQTDECLACAIGSPKAKLEICTRLLARGGQFVNLVHPSVAIGPGTSIGTGVILCQQVIITVNVTLGDFVTVNLHSTIGHDAVIGDGCTLSCHCDVTGHARLGCGCLMGSHASVLPGAIVGDFAVVGAGSVVVKHAPANRTVLGVPARVFETTS